MIILFIFFIFFTLLIKCSIAYSLLIFNSAFFNLLDLSSTIISALILFFIKDKFNGVSIITLFKEFLFKKSSIFVQ